MLYRLHSLREASPKAISGRTSYLHVRLAFHPYPPLIPKLFNAHGFGPPRIFTCASAWPWIDHCGFGSALSDSSFALFRLAFASAPHLLLNLAKYSNSPVHSSIGTPSHHYCASTACKHTVSGSLSLPSRGPFHLSLSVLSSIGRQGVFCLGGWSPLLPTRFLVSRGTLDSGPRSLPFVYRRLTFYALPSHAVRLGFLRFLPVLNPALLSYDGLGSSLFARRYFGNLF